jgi:hypothetical protein
MSAGSDRSPVVRIGRHSAGIATVRDSGAPPTTATGRRPRFRPAPVAGFFGFAFDADNGKDQDGSEAIAGSAIHGRAQPSRSRIRRKFNDGAHIFRSLWLPHGHDLAGDMLIIQNRTWLTAS